MTDETEIETIDALESIADDISDSAPEPQQHAIDDFEITEKARQSEFAELVDADGSPFDPAIHVTDAEGNPKLTTTGKLRKRPGRKSGTGTATKSTIATGPAPDPEAEARRAARATGTVAANLLISMGCMFGGDEWQPRRDAGYDEKAYLETAFADYCEATGVSDIPPGLALTIAISAYAGPRFAMPKTRSKTKSFFMAIKKWWVNRKLKKHGLKATEDKEGGK